MKKKPRCPGSGGDLFRHFVVLAYAEVMRAAAGAIDLSIDRVFVLEAAFIALHPI